MGTTITKYTSRSVRNLASSHTAWATARSGVGVTINAASWVSPNYLVSAGVVQSVGSYYLSRAMMHFPQIDLPAAEDREMLHAHLYIYITDRGGVGSRIDVTRGVHGEPIEPSHWTADTAKVVSGGSIVYDDMVEGQYNAIPLNDTAIGWLDKDGAPNEEYEGYTIKGTTEFFTYGANYWSQSFTPDTTHTITKIKMKIWRVGDAGTVNFVIKAADANHKPTGAVLASGTKVASTITTSTPGEWYEISLGAGVELTAGVEYTLQIYTSAGDASNKVNPRGVSGGNYDGGQVCLSMDSGSTWDSTTYAYYELLFVEYGAGYLDANGDPTTKGTLLTLKGVHDVTGSPPYVGYDGAVSFHSPRYGAGSRAPYLYFEYYKDTFPTANLTRVTAIRHIYRPGLFRMEVTLGDVQNAVDMIDSRVETGAPGPDAPLWERMKYVIELEKAAGVHWTQTGKVRTVPPEWETQISPAQAQFPYQYTPEVPQPFPPTPTPPYAPEVPQPTVPSIVPSFIDVFRERMWSFTKDPAGALAATWRWIKWW